MDFMIFVAVTAVFGFVLCSIAYLGLKRKFNQLGEDHESGVFENDDDHDKIVSDLENKLTLSGQKYNAVVEQFEKLSETQGKSKTLLTKNIIEGLNNALSGDLSAINIITEKDSPLSEDETLSIKLINEFFGKISEVNEEISVVMGVLAGGESGVLVLSDLEGEFGDLKNNINMAVEKINDTFSKVHSSSTSVSDATNLINSSYSKISARISEQSASLQLTAASMEEISSSVSSNVESIHTSSDVVSSANHLAKETEITIIEASTAMAEIEGITNRIKEIIGIIDDIAFQTNLLALNASVEAARAGEQGRGFAVVADEVRNLAGRSAEAAKEIKHLVAESVSKVAIGVSLANDAAIQANEVVITFDRAASSIDDMAESTSEQALGIEEINQSVSQMDSMTQQSATLIDNTMPSIKKLKKSSNELKDSIGIIS